MRKAVMIFAALAVLLAGTFAYAQWGGGPMMRGAYSTEDQKVLDETADLRKDLHLKRFEFREAMRKGEYQKAEALEKEIEAISGKLDAKLGPKSERFGPGAKGDRRGGYGRGYAGGGPCGGPCGGQGGQGGQGGPCW